MRSVARERSANVGQALDAYLNLPGSDEVGLVSRDELSRLLAGNEITLLDVRPEEEFVAGHIPGARNAPLGSLAARASELRDTPAVVAYCRGSFCVMAHDAVRLLGAEGVVGAAARGRHARVAHARPSRWRSVPRDHHPPCGAPLLAAAPLAGGRRCRGRFRSPGGDPDRSHRQPRLRPGDPTDLVGLALARCRPRSSAVCSSRRTSLPRTSRTSRPRAAAAGSGAS